MRLRLQMLIATSGLILLALSYVATLVGVSTLFYNQSNPLYEPSIGLDANAAPFFGVALIFLPYVLGGMVLGYANARRATIIVTGLTAALSERLLILGLAGSVLAGFRQVDAAGSVYYVEGTSHLLTAIQTEALPYFGWPYLGIGVPLSVATLYGVARGIIQWRVKRNLAQPAASVRP